ncbi:hypothetical protein NHX12_015933 [Muraenolepis orangiensis]|uniref:Uncharacterized protein n=1 Tax=Muraenolepis orangiensis TaxID=630683 RepID=A0A9Q0I3I4_9TELE|nr:hypothetical protein NHX12_015933 [Muraenolepis orangiensis]
MLKGTNFIKTDLSLPDTELGIQRSHRALRRSRRGAPSPEYFDQDYPAAIQKKRKAYAPIRTLLKEKGMCFHSPPPAKRRIFYDSPAEAMEDLRKKG